MVTVNDDPGPSRALGPARIVSVEGSALSVPLRDPFVIATGRIDVTRAVLAAAPRPPASARPRHCRP